MSDLLLQYRLWIAILLLLDAGLCLLFEERMRARGLPWNVRRVALVEGAAGMALVGIHFLAGPPGSGAP